MTTTELRLLGIHEGLCIKTICVHKAREEHTNKMMIIVFFHFWKLRESKGNLVINCYIFRDFFLCHFNIIAVIIKSTMVTCNRLCYQRCNLWIKLLCYNCAYVSMVRPLFHMCVFL